MKKIILIVLACLIIAGGVGFYWWKGTPLYSLMQLRSAIAKQDTAKALSYFDTDSIFDSIWTEGFAKVETQVSQSPLLSRFANRLPNLEQKIADNAKPLAKQKFIEMLTIGLANPQTKNASSTDIAGTINEKPTIKIEGDVATIVTTKGVTMVLKKQTDRSWKIVEIKGLFEQALQK